MSWLLAAGASGNPRNRPGGTATTTSHGHGTDAHGLPLPRRPDGDLTDLDVRGLLDRERDRPGDRLRRDADRVHAAADLLLDHRVRRGAGEPRADVARGDRGRAQHA